MAIIRNPRGQHGPVEPWEVEDFREGAVQEDPDASLSRTVIGVQEILDPVLWAIVLILALLIWPIMWAFGVEP